MAFENSMRLTRVMYDINLCTASVCEGRMIEQGSVSGVRVEHSNTPTQIETVSEPWSSYGPHYTSFCITMSNIFPSPLHWHSHGAHHACSPINHHVSASHVATESTRQEARNPCDLCRHPSPFQPNLLLLLVRRLQASRWELRLHPAHIEILQIDAHVDLTRRDTVDADTGPCISLHQPVNPNIVAIISNVPFSTATPLLTTPNAA